MSTVVGALEIQLLADVARLQKDMDTMKRTVDSGMRDIQRMAQGAANALGALGVGLSAAATFAFVKGVVEANAALDDMAEMTGASVESLSALRQVARVSGEDMNNISGAMAKLAKNLAGVDDESKGAGKALAAIGLSVDQLKSMKADEQLLTIAKAMNEFEDGSGKAAVAQGILGKTGAALIPYLKDLAEWGELNATVTAEQAAEAEKLEKSMRTLRETAHLWGEAIVNDIVPAVAELTTELNEAQKAAGGFWSGLALWITTDGAAEANPQKKIAELNATLAGLKKTRDELTNNPTAAKVINNAIFGDVEDIDRQTKALNAQIAYLKQLAQIQAQASINSGNMDARDLKAAQKRQIEYSSIAESATKAAKATKEAKSEFANMGSQLSNSASDIEEVLRKNIEFEKSQIDQEKAWRALTESTAAHALALEKEIENYGKTEAEIQRGILARYEEARSRVVVNEESAKLIAYLEDEIDARKRIIAAAGDKAVLDANKDAAKQAADDWKKIADDINRSLTDAILDGGKSGGELLEDYFRTLILRPIIQGVMQPVSNAIGSAFGGGGSGGNLLSSASNFAGLIGSGGAAAGTLTAANLAGAVGGDALGTLIAGNAAGWGVSSAGVGAGASAMGTIGAALPWVGGALAVAGLLGAFGDDPDAMRTAGFRAGFGGTDADLAGNNWAIDAPQWFSGTEMNDSLLEFQKQIAAQERALIAAIGPNAAQVAAVQGNLAGLTGKRYNFGMEHTDWRQSGAAEAIMADRMAAIASGLGMSLAEIQDYMTTTTASLRASFKDLYTSDADKIAEQTEALAKQFKKLKVEMPATREEFVALVEDSTGKLERGLLKLAPAFDLVAKAAEAEAAAAAERAASLAAMSRSMDIELMQALGDSAGALAAIREDALAALDETLRGKQQEIWAAQDAAAAAQIAQQAIADAQASAAAERLAQLQQEQQTLRGIAQTMEGLSASLVSFRASLGLPGSTGDLSYGSARSLFASTGLAAMAGDEAALGALPGSITGFLDASRGQARTRIDLARDQAAAFAVLDASIATSGGIASRARARGGADPVAAEVAALRAELKAANVAMATYQQETAKILRRWEGNGMPGERVVA